MEQSTCFYQYIWMENSKTEKYIDLSLVESVKE